MLDVQRLFEAILWLFENESPYSALIPAAAMISCLDILISMIWLTLSFTNKKVETKKYRRERAQSWYIGALVWFALSGFIWSPRQAFVINHQINPWVSQTEALTGMNWRLPLNVPVHVVRFITVYIDGQQRATVYINDPADFVRVAQQFGPIFNGRDLHKKMLLLIDSVPPSESTEAYLTNLREMYVSVGGKAETLTIHKTNRE